MAIAGDTFTVILKEPHLKWGSYRHTDSRGIVYGEGYIPIPASDAYRIHTLNTNGTGGFDVLGQNLFRCRSADGLYSGILKAQGNQSNVRYAKQLSGNDDLKAIGDWYYKIGAVIGDKIKVTWESPYDVLIEKI